MSSPVVVRSVRGRHDRTSLCDQVRRGRGPAGRRRTGVGSRSPRSRISRDSSTTTPLALDPVVGPGSTASLSASARSSPGVRSQRRSRRSEPHLPRPTSAPTRPTSRRRSDCRALIGGSRAAAGTSACSSSQRAPGHHCGSSRLGPVSESPVVVVQPRSEAAGDARRIIPIHEAARAHQSTRPPGVSRARGAVVVGLPLAGRPLQTLI
jgi:hypothetical protein